MIIAASSHRPHSESEEYRENQLLAFRTWQGVFDKIIYFGPEEPELASSKTMFVPIADFPSIKEMAAMLARNKGFHVLLNADICVAPRIKDLPAYMKFNGKSSASSRRWHFRKEDNTFDKADMGDDRGRDFFMCRSDIWHAVAETINPGFRIGHQKWDAWMVNFLRAKYNDGFADISGDRLIFHPVHEGRKMPHSEQVAQLTYDF